MALQDPPDSLPASANEMAQRAASDGLGGTRAAHRKNGRRGHGRWAPRRPGARCDADARPPRARQVEYLRAEAQRHLQARPVALPARRLAARGRQRLGRGTNRAARLPTPPSPACAGAGRHGPEPRARSEYRPAPPSPTVAPTHVPTVHPRSTAPPAPPRQIRVMSCTCRLAARPASQHGRY